MAQAQAMAQAMAQAKILLKLMIKTLLQLICARYQQLLTMIEQSRAEIDEHDNWINFKD